jgi:carboxymethylenebutenolidase
MRADSIMLTHPDGDMRLYEARPEEARAAVLVIQEAFGVNDHIEDVTRRLADAGFHAVAPDLFHRTGGDNVPYDDFSAVLPHFEPLEDATLLVDVDVTLDYLRGAGWADRQIGIVGFCMGGRVSFLVCLRRAIGAGVGFYGGGIVTARFAQFPALIDDAATMAVPWLGLFGDQDGGIPIDDVEELRAALERAPADTEIVRYAEAGHGFHNDQREAAYHEADARDAWSRTLDWFDRHLT